MVKVGAIVGFGMTMTYHGNPTPNSILKKKIHVGVCEEFQFDSRVFETRILDVSREGPVMGGVKLVCTNRFLAKILKDICEKCDI